MTTVAPVKREKYSETDLKQLSMMDTFNENRPVSLVEMRNEQHRMLQRCPLGPVVQHASCGHHYRIKANSRKAQNLENDPNEPGGCSVCWGINNRPSNYARVLVDDYMYYFENDKESLPTKQDEHYTWKNFYGWLYPIRHRSYQKY